MVTIPIHSFDVRSTSGDFVICTLRQDIVAIRSITQIDKCSRTPRPDRLSRFIHDLVPGSSDRLDPLSNRPTFISQSVLPQWPTLLIHKILFDQCLHRVPCRVEFRRITRRGERRVTQRLCLLNRLSLRQTSRRVFWEGRQCKYERIGSRP